MRISKSGLMLAAMLSLAPSVMFAQSGSDNSTPVFANPGHFMYRDGEHLYHAICQGCHMADGKGAQGAAAYPALAGNPRLASSLYPVTVLLDGRNGMPSMKGYLDDQQIVAIVNFVRSNFGNHYTDAVTVEDVKKLSAR